MAVDGMGRYRAQHAADCFYLRANPSADGDEGATCSCGAYEDGMIIDSLRQQLEGAVEDITTLRRALAQAALALDNAKHPYAAESARAALAATGGR